MNPNARQAIVIGASAGALDALSRLLSPLPAGYPLPIIVVVHLPNDKKSMIAELLQAKCRIAVREAEDKESLETGTVYIAPSDYHLLVEPGLYLSLSNDEPVLFSRPAVDVLFESAADVFGAGLTGIILTGASNDGAQGLKAVMDEGGVGIVLDPREAYAPVMPEAALRLCPQAKVMSLDDIATHLKETAVS
jgi:two-component system chemotaxis response regulator CheB